MNYLKMIKWLKLSFVVFFIFSTVPIISQASAHSMFNSAEEFIGGYRVQIATLPEFPQIGEKSQLLFRITDGDFVEVDRFTMGVRVFINEQQILGFAPTSYEGAHWETDFVFESPGIHLVKVDLYDMPGTSGAITYTFNISTQSPFGYIFIIAIAIGSMTLAGVMSYVYLPKLFRSRTKP